MAYVPTHHAMDYIEIAATDPLISQKFFEALFGWQFTSYGNDYIAFDDGRLNGGFRRAAADEITGTGAVLVVFYSKDLEATLARVEQLGGLVTQAIYEFPGGRRFHFAGPDKIEYAVWGQHS